MPAPEVDAEVCRGHALRLQRSLEAALDRQSGLEEEPRSRALVEVLREELGSVPTGCRAAVLKTVWSFYPESWKNLGDLPNSFSATQNGASGKVAADDRPHGMSGRGRELLEEVERLRAELVKAKHAGSFAAQDEVPSPVQALIRALVGVGGATDGQLAGGSDALERLPAILNPLIDFLSELDQTFLEGRPGAQSRLRESIAAELSGTSVGGTVQGIVDNLRARIGGQLLAFRDACETGVQQVLRQISPAVIAHRVERETRSALGKRIFYYQVCWEAYARLHEELRTSDGLYEAFFDGAYRNASRRATGGSD